MSLEAVAGKNPVSHVGKIYNVMATLMARDIHENVESTQEISVLLLSEIGRPIGQPQAAVIELEAREGITTALDGRVRAIVDRWLMNVGEVTDLVLAGTAPIF